MGAIEDLTPGSSQHVARDHNGDSSPHQSITTDTSPPPGPPLPSAFDTSLGNNFTSPSCPAFFNSFLTDPSFNDCLPFSLLLQTSNGFFAAQRSLFRLSQTLDATCNVQYAQCSTVMATLAQQIQSEENCGADLAMQNPMVLQAYNGFVAYQPLFHAGCLKDSDGSYCYANAATNSTSPTSSYIYFLPLGIQLPEGTQPTCSRCLRNTMSVFAAYASNSSQPMNAVYNSAAQQVDASCGNRFVAATIQTASGAESVLWSSRVGLLGLLMLLLQLLL